jgi:methylated-DNA-[protein]-cysteine S-methyltransferase
MGILGSQDGLRRLVLPQPSPEQAWHPLSEFALRWHDAILTKAENSYFGDLPQRIKDYLNGKPVNFPDKLDLSRASPSQRRVWQITQSIPYGETRTYRWVADKLGIPKAARAVGQALARNPLPLIIPCHRVIRSDGSLGGFSGGRNWKQRLLKIEAKTI